MNAAMYRFLCGMIAASSLLMVNGCSDDDDNNPTGPGNSSSTIAVVQTSGADEENLSVIDYKTGTAYNDLLSLNGISNLYQYGKYVYIVDKDGNRIIKFDPFSRTPVSEMSTGVGTAPYCMAFVSATKAYVTLGDADSVAIVNPSLMTITGSIDISDMADSDGDPDQYDAVIKGDNLYVALRRASGRTLSDHSSIAVIDTKADTVITECILVTNGIGSSSRNSLGGRVSGASSVTGTLYPYVIGSVSYTTDGAIEEYDTETLTTSVLYSETQTGGNIVIWAFDTPSTGYAIAGLSTTSGGQGWGLKRFDLTAGTFSAIGSYQQSELTWGLDVTDDGLVLVGSRDEENPGVLVLDSANEYAHKFANPIDTGLMPRIILVVR